MQIELEHKVEVEKTHKTLRNIFACIIIILIMAFVVMERYFYPPKLTGRGERVALVIPVAYFYCVENLEAYKYGIKEK